MNKYAPTGLEEELAEKAYYYRDDWSQLLVDLADAFDKGANPHACFLDRQALPAMLWDFDLRDLNWEAFKVDTFLGRLLSTYHSSCWDAAGPEYSQSMYADLSRDELPPRFHVPVEFANKIYDLFVDRGFDAHDLGFYVFIDTYMSLSENYGDDPFYIIKQILSAHPQASTLQWERLRARINHHWDYADDHWRADPTIDQISQWETMIEAQRNQSLLRDIAGVVGQEIQEMTRTYTTHSGQDMSHNKISYEETHLYIQFDQVTLHITNAYVFMDNTTQIGEPDNPDKLQNLNSFVSGETVKDIDIDMDWFNSWQKTPTVLICLSGGKWVKITLDDGCILITHGEWANDGENE
ncbi:MAG: hypothetical protein FWG08_02750 [Propionibacteriaceae bacterium]|jgi:hypothetical protein|nr:hypothetical protein [Propionibacteriaceae bacterium]